MSEIVHDEQKMSQTWVEVLCEQAYIMVSTHKKGAEDSLARASCLLDRTPHCAFGSEEIVMAFCSSVETLPQSKMNR